MFIIYISYAFFLNRYYCAAAVFGFTYAINIDLINPRSFMNTTSSNCLIETHLYFVF